jgi:uncharacterized protein
MADQMKSGFVWYELMTSGDLESAVSFYQSVVGWDVRDSGMPGMRYMLFGKDGKDVGGMMSWKDMGMNHPTSWKGHIFTPDVEAETKAVVADGGQEFRPVQTIPGVGKFSVVGDPQGAEYLLFQPEQAGGAPPRLGPTDVGAVNWHELATKDWEKAWEFYSKHYGWTKANAIDMGPMGKYQLFMLDSDRPGGGMMNLPPGAPGPLWNFYVTVEDIQQAAQRVKEKGGTVVHGPSEVPGGGWILNGVDPQGGRFSLTAAK